MIVVRTRVQRFCTQPSGRVSPTLMRLPRHSSDSPHLLQSPVPHLNHPPSEAEYTTVEQAIATVEAGMNVGGPVSHKSLAPPTEVYIQTHRPIRFPLRWLPPELLGEIFQYCEEEHEDLNLNSPPWYLLHVCQLWRQASLGMSTLWRHLPPMVHHPKSKRLNLPKLQFLLQISSNAKITFLLYQTHYLVPNGVLPLLLQHSRRWERVALYVSDYVCEFLNRSTVGRLPSLTTLTIDFQVLKRSHALFVDAPKLRSLRCAGFLDNPMIPLHSSTLLLGPLRWKLTSFTSHAVLLHTHTLLKVLVESQQLEKLDVSLRAFDDPWLQIPPTTLPSLTSLALRFPPGPQVHQSILFNLMLPCLSELFIGLFLPRRLFDDFAGMITRSMCPLQHLTIQSSSRHLNWNIIDALKLTPQLKSLNIDGLVDQRLTEKLCSWNEKEGWELVPSLESLTMHTEGQCHLPHLAVARCDFVESGLQVRQRLENFFVASSSPLDSLEDLQDIPIPASFEKLLMCLRSADWLLESKSDYGPDFKRIFSKQVNDLLSLVRRIKDANEILYLYYAKITTVLWKFLTSVPLELRIALSLRTRYEDLFTVWTNVLTQSSSHTIRWIWDKHGYLKYARDSAEDRAFLFFRLKRSLLEKMPADRNFPYNEDDIPVNSLV